ncbi:TetR/AcrR family transcriptional regulator [Thauera chlorobenzoica]|uniref:Transcriptional regulator, TetR family n=1 Tax=Thauera chlorobenzoica TaxID=96773 RepID=A0A1L6FBD7_9RHOO|nr:TetR/AcrR family transcriptional regulator [Thauera chlorobenzoica]APR04153.1 Transcriptional regulator, TetR family [Thauera chlorobenzoica]
MTIKAVIELAGLQNPSEITTAAIAKHMNLTQGALFRYFPNRDAIWKAVMEWIVEHLLARIDRSTQGVESPLAAMEAMFMSHVDFMAEYPGVPRMMFGELQRAESTPAKRMVQALIQRYGERLNQLIENGKGAGLIGQETIGAETMTNDSMNWSGQEHLKRWWETTRYYLRADMEYLASVGAIADDGWPSPQTDSCRGRKRLIARVRGRLFRSVKCGGEDDPLRELESVLHRQLKFIARHPAVPLRLLSWLEQDGELGVQRRVRMLISYYATRLAQIIARAQRHGLIRADAKPYGVAFSLVGLIQKLVLETGPAPQQTESFLKKAADAFALYFAALTVPPKGMRAEDFWGMKKT